MNKSYDIKRLRFYLWTGLAHFTIGILFALHDMDTSFGRHFLNELWHAIFIMVINTWLFEYVWPRLRLNNLLQAILLVVFQIFLMSWVAYLWRNFGISLGVFTPLTTYKNTGANVGAQMADSMGGFMFFGIVRHIYNYVLLKRMTQQLRIEKQEAELNYLKSQTNPHFLFNTLNNIYSLSRDKSDLAPESILKLSKILRYMLYEAGGQYIAIEQEIKIMNDYIALEKLRYDESLHVNFNYNIEDMKQSMPPLLLIPLVENAFKHGVSETRNRPFVDIHLSVNKRLLTFIIKNSTDGAVGEVKENIGLSNLRRQLELLYKEYSLNVQHGETTFTATLKINLATRVQNQVHNS